VFKQNGPASKQN